MADLYITESDAVESISVQESVTVRNHLEIFQFENVAVSEYFLGITGLALDDGVLSDLQIDAAMGVNLWVDPPDIIRTVDGVYGWLPDLQIDAAMDVRTLELDEGLSDLQCIGHMGASTREDVLDPLYLSELQGDGEVYEDPVISLDAILSQLEGEGYLGALLDEKLSELRIEAELSGVGGLDADLWLPGLEIEATIISETLLSLDKRLTFLVADAYIQESLDLQLDSMLPGLVLAGNMLLGTILSLDGTLSELQGEATILSETYLSLDGYISPLVVVVADGKGGGGAKGSVSEDDRFEDYIMRYSRW